MSGSEDFHQETKSAFEILDEVLGVSFTYPIWVEEKLEQIIKKYDEKSSDEIDFSELRSELSTIGLERLVPYTIQNILERHDDQD